MADNTDQIIETCASFHSAIANIIKVVEQKDACPELERLKRLIGLCKAESPVFLIDRCKDKLWESREQIKTRDEKYFFESDFSKYIKKGSAYESFQFSLMNLIRENYKAYTEPEKKLIWKYVRQMLRCVAKYKHLIGEYQ
jgi:hypothetical protein